MVAHLDAVTSLSVDPNGLYLLSGSKLSHVDFMVKSYANITHVYKIGNVNYLGDSSS